MSPEVPATTTPARLAAEPATTPTTTAPAAADTITPGPSQAAAFSDATPASPTVAPKLRLECTIPPCPPYDAAWKKPLAVELLQLHFHVLEEHDGEKRSVDNVAFHPTMPRIATSGSDRTVKLWDVDWAAIDAMCRGEEGSGADAAVRFVSTLGESGVEAPIPNSLRWSPHGRAIAAAYPNDLVLWTKSEEGPDPEDIGATERWEKHMSLTNEEVRDVDFSPDGTRLCYITQTGKVSFVGLETSSNFTTKEHDGLGQGVAWDPLGERVVTTGSDKRINVFDVSGKVPELRRTSKAHGKLFQMHVGAEYGRRPSWSPDGALVAFPLGLSRDDTTEYTKCAYLFHRADMSKPFMSIAPKDDGPKLRVSGVRFAPCVFEPFDDDVENPARRTTKCSWGPVNYRYAFALWTPDTVVVYTSDTSGRYCACWDMHYRRITDVSWAPDARGLMVSSLDGFLTVIRFLKPIGTVLDLTKSTADAPVLCQRLGDRLSKINTALVVASEKLDQARKRTVITTAKKKKKTKKRDRSPGPAGAAQPAPPAATEEALMQAMAE